MQKHHYIYTWLNGNLRAYYVEEVLRKIKWRYPNGSSLEKTTRLVQKEFGKFASCSLGVKSLTELYKELEKRGIIELTQWIPFGDNYPVPDGWCNVVSTKSLERILDDKT